MKKFIYFLTISLAIIFSINGYAGMQNGKITNVDETGYLVIEGDRTDTPSCAAEDKWIIDMTRKDAKTLLDYAKNALEDGKSVMVSGNGSCNISAGMETVESIFVMP